MAEKFPYVDARLIRNEAAKVYRELNTLDDVPIEDIVIAALSEAGYDDPHIAADKRVWVNGTVTGAFIGKTGSMD